MSLRKTQLSNWLVVITPMEMFLLMEDRYGMMRNDNLVSFQLLTLFSDYSWGYNDARVICRMLGLDTIVAKPTYSSQYGDVGTDYILSYAECSGTEAHISQCKQGPGSICNTNGGRGAGVMCIPPGPTSDIPLELVGGSDNTEGNVKIYGQPIA